MKQGNMNVWSMKSSKIELPCFVLSHTSNQAGAYTAWLLLVNVSYAFFLEGCHVRPQKLLPQKWVIKRVQWFAWPAACRIVFGRHGNLIRFSDSGDWAAPKCNFSEYLWSSLWASGDGVSLESGAGGGGHVGQRSKQSIKNSGKQRPPGGLLTAFYSFLGFVTLIPGTHFGRMVSHLPISKIKRMEFKSWLHSKGIQMQYTFQQVIEFIPKPMLSCHFSEWRAHIKP